MKLHIRIAVSCLGLSLAFVVGGCAGEENEPADETSSTTAPNTGTGSGGAGRGASDSDAVSGLFESGSGSSGAPTTTGSRDASGGEATGADGTTVSFLGLTGPRAESWIPFAPTSSMRAANYRVTGSGGDAEIVVFHFPGVGGGPKQMNIERWIGQFSDQQMEPSITEFEANGMPVTLVELAGTYQGMSAPPAPNSHFFGAIVESPTVGNVYIRLVGPEATVMENKDAFLKMLNELKPG